MNQLLNLKGMVWLNNLCILFIIVNRKDEKKVINILDKYKAGFKVVVYGKGTATDSILDYFGVNDEEKSIITVVLPPIVCKHVLREVEERINVKEHGRGIAFSILLSSSTKYMLDFYAKHEMEDIIMETANQELIITIVNEGYAEKVMLEAKKGGATGGTTINGRGLANEKTIKILNISIEPEKDIVLNLVSADKKNDIMKLIVDNCGLKTPGAGICFSLPVDHVVGLNKNIDRLES